MRIIRQKTFARGLFTRGTFGNRMKSLYHNTGEAVNRRISRSVSSAAAYPDITGVSILSNVIQPGFGASVGGATGAAIAVAPTGPAYFLGVKKLNNIKVNKDGKTLGDIRLKVAKKAMRGTKEFLDNHNINQNMKNLDQTRVGQGLAKVYKGGSKVYEAARSGVIDAKNNFSSDLASTGSLARRPATRF